MIMNVYAIFDEKSSAFGQPFFFAANGQATRAFADVVSDPQTTVSKHPSDYKLYKLGVYDDNSGCLTSCDKPEFLAHGSEFVVPVARSAE